MGQIVSEFNPMVAVVDGVKAVCHDCSVYVCNACKSECNFCGCWTFTIQTTETHEESDSTSSESSWASDPMKNALCCGE